MQDLEKNPWESYPTYSYKNVSELAERNARRNVWDIQYRRVLSVWPYMVVFAVLSLFGAAVYLRYIPDEYEVSGSIVIIDNNDVSIGQALFSSRDPLQDQVALLQSPTLAKRVVDSLGLQYHEYIDGKLKDRDLYRNINWKVLFRPPDDNSFLRFTCYPADGGFGWHSNGLKGKAIWGQPFTIGDKVVVVNQYKYFTTTPFVCYETNPIDEAFTISEKLKVSSGTTNSVVSLSYRDYVPARAIDIINNIISIYRLKLQEDKTRSLSLSVEFISRRLLPLSQELDSIETNIARYKSAKGLVGMSANGALYLEKTQRYDNELNQIDLQKKMINSVEGFLKDASTKDDQFYLVSVLDPALMGVISQFEQSRTEREKLALSVTEDNPQLKILDKRIAVIRNNIEVQMALYRKNIKLREENYNNNLTDARKLLAGSPAEEKSLLEQSRQQSIKQSLFLLLLQRKEEAAITLSGVSVQTNIIRPVRPPQKPVSPPRKEILLGALFAGLWIPLLFTLLKEFLNNKIISKAQLSQMVSAPVIGELDMIEKSKDILEVKRKDRSIFGEQIRALRANLRYYYGEAKPFYVLLTSSMSGEGKTFISANLAASYALQGKKVALLEFDLRRPKLRARMGVEKRGPGISTVLIGRDKPEDVYIKIYDDDTLHLFPSGPVPPNPSELMAAEQMDTFKKYLDEHYDVVVIDTPPYGIVADAQLMQSWANIAVIVTRFRMTIREQVHEIEEWNRTKLFKNMALVFNGIRTKGYYGYKYGYYYTKRKYGSPYYYRDEKDIVEENKDNNSKNEV